MQMTMTISPAPRLDVESPYVCQSLRGMTSALTTRTYSTRDGELILFSTGNLEVKFNGIPSVVRFSYSPEPMMMLLRPSRRGSLSGNLGSGTKGILGHLFQPNAIFLSPPLTNFR
jgi:hypothetical protein